MHLGAALVADEQALEVVQPGEAALDDPPEATEPGAVLGLATGDLGPDSETTSKRWQPLAGSRPR